MQRPTIQEGQSGMRESSDTKHRTVRRHLVEGWGLLFLFACLGILLEVLLAFKVQAYVNLAWETRRLMWRLAHAHGTLLALVHLAAAFTFSRLPAPFFVKGGGLASGCLSGAAILIPGGFFLSGTQVEGGDPGASIALVPAGAFLLLISMGLLGGACWRMRTSDLVGDGDGTGASRSSSRDSL